MPSRIDTNRTEFTMDLNDTTENIRYINKSEVSIGTYATATEHNYITQVSPNYQLSLSRKSR